MAYPYRAKVIDDAHAYSVPNGMDWGKVDPNKEFTAVSEDIGFIKLEFWPKNGKPFWVRRGYVVAVSEAPTQPPSLPPPDEFTMKWLKDGQVFTTQDYVKKNPA